MTMKSENVANHDSNHHSVKGHKEFTIVDFHGVEKLYFWTPMTQILPYICENEYKVYAICSPKIIRDILS